MRKLCSMLLMVCLIAGLIPGASAAGMIQVPRMEQAEAQADRAVIQIYTGEITREDQEDIYQVTVPQDGRLRIEMAELYGGATVLLRVYNRLGERVDSFSGCGNGSGLTLKGLKAGDTYEIRVGYFSKMSAYQLIVGMPKAAADISNITRLTDFIEYTDQRNFYTFTVRRDGRVRLELSEMMAGFTVSMFVFNRLGEKVDSFTGIRNGSGLTLKGLKAGETYTVAVDAYTGVGEYTLLIAQQKETVSCAPGTVVQDWIEFTDQRNVYTVTPNGSEMTVALQETPADLAVSLLVFNRLGEQVDSYSGMKNGGWMTLKGLNPGETYEIQVRHYTGYGSYQLRID